MITVTKTFEFEAAHFLPGYDGKCSQMHGHSYKLEVEVAGAPVAEVLTPYDSMVIDFGTLRDIVQVRVIDRVDHMELNDIFMAPPTAETMVDWIQSQLVAVFKHHLRRVRLWETSTSYAEWRPD